MQGQQFEHLVLCGSSCLEDRVTFTPVSLHSRKRVKLLLVPEVYTASLFRLMRTNNSNQNQTLNTDARVSQNNGIASKGFVRRVPKSVAIRHVTTTKQPFHQRHEQEVTVRLQSSSNGRVIHRRCRGSPPHTTGSLALFTIQ